MELNRMMDHTILKADTPKSEVLRIIEEAKKYHFYSVCINPVWVSLAAEELKGEPVSVCTVIGFPLGASTTATKAFETEDAIKNGADEIDMVISIGQLKSGDYEAVQNDIAGVVAAAKDRALVKVILETCLLTDEEIVKACELAKAAGADFVKTSTGFSTGGADVNDVRLMRETVGPEMGVKASGGIHNEAQALAMVEAGASRLGTSASVAIISGANGTGY
ncbi:deoxyribose-phosphate aldolase [Enterococcus saccharolyticus]|uniref:Deoxyribose-phosphate aldolase n=1 Tax=Enterococcus saccharolyticus subsp. saccharolyticus ATCC 43076 TaxID=1139996 RepID=S0P310_9ENTE|nr:deoxyribose-phosphate aldolase [Enterococcus saccharolyticus]EOT25692.1 deoxyribose-phosphate aldolase [Enterococcus saccharolyticus subsp. saccharolyticus ATCC 43076]EOT83198.1 deoxyribose-phosphate aldolase [Enterococcus saccharolyticus subsp. saccharolyticus ATCC 43076]